MPARFFGSSGYAIVGQPGRTGIFGTFTPGHRHLSIHVGNLASPGACGCRRGPAAILLGAFDGTG